MQITLKALFDDDTRAEIRKFLLGEVRGLARAEAERVFSAEVERSMKAKLADLFTTITGTKQIDRSVGNVFREIFEGRWDAISRMIQESVDRRVDMAAQQKLKNKTVWEAEKQRDFILEIARQETDRLRDELEIQRLTTIK